MIRFPIAWPALACSDPILEDRCELACRIRKRHKAVTDVAWGQHTELATEVTRRTAIVSHRHNGGGTEAIG